MVDECHAPVIHLMIHSDETVLVDDLLYMGVEACCISTFSDTGWSRAYSVSR